MKMNSLLTSMVSLVALTFGTAALATSPASPQAQGAEQDAQQTGDYYSDAAIKANVQSALMAQASGMQINVEVVEGAVVLSGQVDTYEDVIAVERIVRDIDGVTSVRNELEVRGE